MIVEHAGVKGMHWGVRKAAKEADNAWRKEMNSADTANKVYNAAVKTANPAIKKLNNDPMFKGKDLSKDHSLAKQYDAIVGEIFNQHLAQASSMTLDSSGTKAFVYQFDRHTSTMKATEVQRVGHADGDNLPVMDVELDAMGFVVKILPPKINPIAHGEYAVKEILEHVGVKGMHWGVRKSAPASSGDAKRAAKLKAKPLSALTNKQLKEVNERLNLETNYKRMNPSSISKGKHTAQAVLATAGIGVAAYNLVKSPAGKALINIGKKVISGRIKADPFGAVPKFP